MPSRAKQLADEEAARNEAQPDGGGEPDEGDGDGEPEGDDAPSDETAGEPSAERMRALDDEQVRHYMAVQDIMGPFVAGFVACDECNGVGLTQPVEFKPHDRYKMCDTCNGLGNVLTGSRIETNATAPCPACQGRGYLEKLTVPPPAGEPVISQPNGGEQYGTPPWMGSPDVQPEAVYGPPSS